MVAENSPAYCHIDTVVRGTTSRWQELVVLLSNTEEELSHVLITWQVCSNILLGTVIMYIFTGIC